MTFVNDDNSEELIATKADGKESLVVISRERMVGSGGFGNAYSVKTDKGISLVLKEYQWHDRHENAEKAFQNYQRAKRAGMRVFTTFRLVKDFASILMTNGLINDRVCLASNIYGPTTLKDLGEDSLPNIKNLVELMEAVFLQARLANNSNINISQDCFFFFVKRRSQHVTFIVGDLDFITPMRNPGTISYAENMYSAYSALKILITHNVKNCSDAIEALVQFMKQEMDRFGLPFLWSDPDIIHFVED